jgi:hypothetical protein
MVPKGLFGVAQTVGRAISRMTAVDGVGRKSWTGEAKIHGLFDIPGTESAQRNFDPFLSVPTNLIAQGLGELLDAR